MGLTKSKSKGGGKAAGSTQRQAVVYNTTRSSEQVEACRLAVGDDGAVAVVGDKDIDGCGAWILSRWIQDKKTGQKLWPADGEAFLESLPYAYHGTLMRVGLVDVGAGDAGGVGDADASAETPEPAERLKAVVLESWKDYG